MGVVPECLDKQNRGAGSLEVLKSSWEFRRWAEEEEEVQERRCLRGAGSDSPRGKRIGGQSRFEPIEKGLRGGEIGINEGHGGDTEKSTIFVREREEFGEDGEGLVRGMVEIRRIVAVYGWRRGHVNMKGRRECGRAAAIFGSGWEFRRWAEEEEGMTMTWMPGAVHVGNCGTILPSHQPLTA